MVIRVSGNQEAGYQATGYQGKINKDCKINNAKLAIFLIAN
jgi:hypothetical protein